MRRACVAVALVWTAAADAQLAFSLQAVSDYRYRGVSLSNEKPDLRASASYDDPSGWFGGASLTAVELDPGRRRAEWLGYVGFASRAASGLGWEAGATALHYAGASRFDHAEVFAGAIGARWNARLHYAPDYFGAGLRTAYVDLNASQPLPLARLRWIGHAGLLQRLDGTLPADVRRRRADLRTGVAAALGDWDVQLAWVGVGRDGRYAYAAPPRRSTWVLSATLAL